MSYVIPVATAFCIIPVLLTAMFSVIILSTTPSVGDLMAMHNGCLPWFTSNFATSVQRLQKQVIACFACLLLAPQLCLTPKQCMEQVSEVTDITKKAVYSSLGHSSIPVQYLSPPIPDSPSFTCVSSPAPAALHTAEIRGGLTSVCISTVWHMTVFSCCRHSYASVVSPPSPRLCESGAVPYSDTPTALCGSVSGKH